MTCEIQMLEEEVAAVHRYNEALAEGLRACSEFVGVELPSTERDLSDVAGRVQAKVEELTRLKDYADACANENLERANEHKRSLDEYLCSDETERELLEAKVKELKTKVEKLQKALGDDAFASREWSTAYQTEKAKVEELEAAREQRPMADAPKEGPGVLAWTGFEFGYLIVMWTGSCWCAPDFVGISVVPQHWYPLPDEPVESGEVEL